MRGVFEEGEFTGGFTVDGTEDAVVFPADELCVW